MSNKKKSALRMRSLPKNIQWMHDFDYLAKLDKGEKAWMEKFISEYYHARVKKGDRKALHKNRSLRQDCYTRKNAQNRDLQSIMNCNGNMDRVRDLEDPAEKMRTRNKSKNERGTI